MIQLVIGIAVCAGIIYAVAYIFAIVLVSTLFISSNAVVAADGLFGSWAIFGPVFSWAVMGFTLGASLYFAVIESHRLNRPGVKPALITLCCCLVFMTPLLGPSTAGIKSVFYSSTENSTKPPLGSSDPATRSKIQTKDSSSLKDNEGELKTPGPSPTKSTAGGSGSQSSQDIEDEVEKRLAAGGFAGLTIREFEGGIITISGTVANQKDLEKVEDIAKGVASASKVTTVLTLAPKEMPSTGALTRKDSFETASSPSRVASVSSSSSPPPPDLKKRAEKELAKKGFPGLSVMESENGVVTISGTVGDSRDVEIVKKIAGEVPGVKAVEVKLRVAVKEVVEKPEKSKESRSPVTVNKKEVTPPPAIQSPQEAQSSLAPPPKKW